MVRRGAKAAPRCCKHAAGLQLLEPDCLDGIAGCGVLFPNCLSEGPLLRIEHYLSLGDRSVLKAEGPSCCSDFCGGRGCWYQGNRQHSRVFSKCCCKTGGNERISRVLKGNKVLLLAVKLLVEGAVALK